MLARPPDVYVHPGNELSAPSQTHQRDRGQHTER